MRKHDAVVAELGKWCEEHGCYVEREAIMPQANPDTPRRGWTSSCISLDTPHIYIDVTIISAQSVEALNKGSGNRDGVACEIAAKRKVTTYPISR